MHAPINPPVPRYFLPAKHRSRSQSRRLQPRLEATHDHQRRVLSDPIHLKHQGWLIKYELLQLVVRDHPIIHSLWLDFESDEGASGLAVPVDVYGCNNQISPVDLSTTPLDVVAGDELVKDKEVWKVKRVAIFRATPAPELTANMPVYEIHSGKAWLAEMQQGTAIQS